jgi:hypothetical protein
MILSSQQAGRIRSFGCHERRCFLEEGRRGRRA